MSPDIFRRAALRCVVPVMTFTPQKMGCYLSCWMGFPSVKSAIKAVSDTVMRTSAVTERDEALHQVTQEVETVSEYMRLMEAAPLLKAQGLDENYKQLADFKGVVLAGHPTRFGVQFATWDWDYGRTGVSQGHYMSNYYEVAKKDFAVHSGLIRNRLLFSPKHLTELHRCSSNELDNNFNLTYEQEKSVENIRMHLRSLVRDLDERLRSSQTVSPQAEQTM